MKRVISVIVFVCLTVLAFSQSDAVLKIGFIDSKPDSVIKKSQVFSDYMGTALASQGITSATLVVAKDTAEMAALINAKKVDIYIDTAYAVLEVSRSAKIEYTYRRWKKGVSEYRSILVAKKDSPLKNLTGLEGLKIGFEDVSSTSGRWLAQILLQDMGYTLVDSTGSQTNTAKKIGYLFTGSSDNTPVWVMQGKIDVGVISSNDYDEVAPAVKSKLKIIGESPSVPRQFIAVRSSLSSGMKTSLKKVLLEMDKSESGKALLADWEKTTKIDELTAANIETIKNLEMKIFK